MSIRDFMYGFLQGFDQAGGTQKLSSWTARNIAGGQYYDPMSDPYFMQQLAQAKSMDIPTAYQRFADTWGQYIDLPEGQTLDQYLFNKEPEPQNIYGIPVENFRNLMLEIASRGQDIPVDVLKEYEKTTGINISPVLQMVSPEKQGNTFEDMIRLYANVRNVESPVLQDTFMQEYSDLLPAGVTPEDLFPEQRPGVLDLLRADLRNLAPEDVERYRDAGYHVTEVYPGWYAVQEGLSAEKPLKPIELFRAGLLPLTPEQVSSYQEAGYYPVAVPGYEGWYSLVQAPPAGEEGFDYNQLGLQDLLGMIMMDRQVTPDERAIWENSPWRVFGQPEDLVSRIATESPGFDIDDSRIYGMLPNGEIVYKTAAGGFVTKDRVLIPAEIQSIVPSVIEERFSMPQNRKVIQAPDGRWLYENMSGYLVYEDGTPFTDDEGNLYYIGSDFFGGEQRILSTGSKNVLTGEDGFSNFLFADEQEDAGEDTGFIQGIFDSLSETFGNLFKVGKEEGEQDRVNELTQEYIERYPNNTPEDIARFLASLSKEDKKEFKEIYGVDINKVISELNRRKKDEQ